MWKLWRISLQAESLNRCIAGISSEGAALERLACVRHWPSLEAKKWVESFVQIACSDTSLAAVVLLGSVVRLVERVNDVDILYIYKNKKIRCPRRSIDVDLRAYSQEDVLSSLARGHDLLGWALHFGYLICEQDLYWTSLRENWLNKLPFPDPKIAVERARKATEMYRKFYEMGDIDAAKEQLLTSLTHQARARLLFKRVYPRSRPELPEQLRNIDEIELAESLAEALRERDSSTEMSAH
jgi:hypothetical protein